jgi:hypothetical protein
MSKGKYHHVTHFDSALSLHVLIRIFTESRQGRHRRIPDNIRHSERNSGTVLPGTFLSDEFLSESSNLISCNVVLEINTEFVKEIQGNQRNVAQIFNNNFASLLGGYQSDIENHRASVVG